MLEEDDEEDESGGEGEGTEEDKQIERRETEEGNKRKYKMIILSSHDISVLVIFRGPACHQIELSFIDVTASYSGVAIFESLPRAGYPV
jgi:hypothetical protein